MEMRNEQGFGLSIPSFVNEIEYAARKGQQYEVGDCMKRDAPLPEELLEAMMLRGTYTRQAAYDYIRFFAGVSERMVLLLIKEGWGPRLLVYPEFCVMSPETLLEAVLEGCKGVDYFHSWCMADDLFGGEGVLNLLPISHEEVVKKVIAGALDAKAVAVAIAQNLKSLRGLSADTAEMLVSAGRIYDTDCAREVARNLGSFDDIRPETLLRLKEYKR